MCDSVAMTAEVSIHLNSSTFQNSKNVFGSEIAREIKWELEK